MTATLATVNGILKEVYEGNINNMLNEERITIKRLERTAEGVNSNAVGGKYVTFPIRTGRNHGISYRAENVQLAPAGRQQLSSGTETLKYGYGRVRLTGPLIALAESNTQAFASAMDIEMDGLKSDLSRDENRIAYGHTDSSVATGILAKTTAISSGTTITVDSTQYIEAGMVIDITATGTPVSGGTGAVVASVVSATVFTTTVAVAGVVVGNYVSRTGNYNMEPNGLNKIVDSTGILHGINPTTVPSWASYEDGTTSSLTELAMIGVMDQVKNTGQGSPTVIFASMGVRRAYWNLLTSMRRYNEPKQWTGGLVGLAFQHDKELPVVADRDTTAKHMFFIDEKEIKIWRDKDWHWEDIDGAVLKWVNDYDAFEGLMKQYWQIGTHRRNAHAKLTNITES